MCKAIGLRNRSRVGWIWKQSGLFTNIRSNQVQVSLREFSSTHLSYNLLKISGKKKFHPSRRHLALMKCSSKIDNFRPNLLNCQTRSVQPFSGHYCCRKASNIVGFVRKVVINQHHFVTGQFRERDQIWINWIVLLFSYLSRAESLQIVQFWFIKKYFLAIITDEMKFVGNSLRKPETNFIWIVLIRLIFFQKASLWPNKPF